MSLRAADETREQEARAVEASEDLDYALGQLAEAIKVARRRIGKKPKAIDLSGVVGGFRTVERAEQNLDIRLHDLHTARGEDA